MVLLLHLRIPLLYRTRPFHRSIVLSSSLLMSSIPLLKPLPHPRLFLTLAPPPPEPASRVPSFHLSVFRASSHRSHAHARVHTDAAVPAAYSEKPEPRKVDSAILKALGQRLAVHGIHLNLSMVGQETRMLCPRCEGGQSVEESLSVFVADDGTSARWNCFRANCGWKGLQGAFADSNSSHGRAKKVGKVKKVREITVEDCRLEPLCDELFAYFETRNISRSTLQRNSVMQKTDYEQVYIAFTYWRNGILVNCKYRDANKGFLQEKDTEKIFYGLDDIKGASEIIIVEGEMDKLAMEEAGFRNCVSVPDGAPASVSTKQLPPEEEDTKYHFLWNCKEYLQKVSRIILATDADLPGEALAEELARRLGRERCWRVRWPKKNDNEYFKDANEVLMHLGPGELRDVIEDAELYPIRGLFNFSDFYDEIDAYYHQTSDIKIGVSTGWSAMNDFYNVMPGELTIISGVPNSGKSEWIDALLCNLNNNEGWKFALCSMENKVHEHARKLMEKHVKKPFFDARYGESVERMTVDDFNEGKKWLNDTFYLIRCENDCLPNIKWVLDLARIAVLRHGIRGLVIDPYNELDHQRAVSQTETEYVSQMLTMVKRFAQHHCCHVWFVAHPRQMHNWTGGPPSLYDISGSAHFINKCDNGIVIHRNRDPGVGPIDLVQVCVRKVRNKVVGKIGDVFLSYNRVTGEYTVADECFG